MMFFTQTILKFKKKIIIFPLQKSTPGNSSTSSRVEAQIEQMAPSIDQQLKGKKGPHSFNVDNVSHLLLFTDVLVNMSCIIYLNFHRSHTLNWKS